MFSYYFNFIIELNFMLCFNYTNCFCILCFILNDLNYFLFLVTDVSLCIYISLL